VLRAIPESAQEYTLLTTAVAALRAILDPGTGSVHRRPIYHRGGKGSGNVEHFLKYELARLQHPEPVKRAGSRQGDSGAVSKPVTAFESALVACGVWLTIWRDERAFSTGDDLTRELGRAILGRRKFYVQSRYWDEKKRRYLTTALRPSTRVCMELGRQIRTALLSLLVFVRDEAFEHPERYNRPMKESALRQPKPLPTFYGNHTMQTKAAKKRAGIEVLNRFYYCAEDSPLARRFNTTTTTATKKEKSKKMAPMSEQQRQEVIAVANAGHRIVKLSTDRPRNEDIDALVVAGLRTPADGAVPAVASTAPERPASPANDVAYEEQPRSQQPQQTAFTFSRTNYVKPNAAITEALTHDDDAADQQQPQDEDVTDAEMMAVAKEHRCDLNYPLGRAKALGILRAARR